MLKAFLVGSLVYLIAAGALAQSQRQPQQRPPSGQNTQQAAPDQRGTDQIPFTVKILPAETAKKEAEKAEAEKAEKAAIDKRLAFDTQRLADYTWWLANYTWWLEAFTALLFSVAIFQVAMFVWQLILIKRGTHDATVAANAALLSAQVARNEFVATHRPRLRVRGILFDGFTTVEILPAWIYVANIGANDATNIRFDAVFVQKIAPGIREAPWIENLSPDDTHGPQKLMGGERGTYEPSPAAHFLPFEADEIGKGARTLMLIGRIRYTDRCPADIDSPSDLSEGDIHSLTAYAARNVSNGSMTSRYRNSACVM
jgi:hypothetical protein